MVSAVALRLRRGSSRRLNCSEEHVVERLPVPLVRARRPWRAAVATRPSASSSASRATSSFKLSPPRISRRRRVDDLALLVHDVVVLEQVLADVEVVAPRPSSARSRSRAVIQRCSIGSPSSMPEPLHQLLDALGAEDAHQVVFEREVEARRARDRPGGRSGRAAGCRCGGTRGARCRGCAGRPPRPPPRARRRTARGTSRAPPGTSGSLGIARAGLVGRP